MARYPFQVAAVIISSMMMAPPARAAAAAAPTAAAPATKPAKPQMTFSPEVAPLDFSAPGRPTLLKKGTFGAVASGIYRISDDDGKTWQPVGKLYDGPGPGIPGGGMLAEATDGTLVLVYRDEKGMVSDRYKEGDRHRIKPGAEYPIWSIRSADGGKTWTDRQKIFPGYCGALIDILATNDGRVVVPITNLLYEPERNGTSVYSTGDGGKTWHEAKVIDIGGRGLEDGAFEASLAERKNGSLLMFMRTTRDFIWQSTSTDGGRTWTDAKPTTIAASNSPPNLEHLASGRLALAYNQLHAEDNPNVARRVGYAEKPESVFREELSFSISSDGGTTWTKPKVIARQPGARLAYTQMFERRPGEIWLAVRGQWVRIDEATFAGK